jgi:phosphate transport system permease protein
VNRRLSQNLAFTILRAAGFTVVLPVLLVIYFLVSKGAGAINWEFLTAMPRSGMMEGGILSPIVGTLWLIVCTGLIAVPLGLLSAIYLSEYAKPGPFTRLVRLAIVNLAGVPSVVYGLFGYGVFVLLIGFGKSILAGSLTLALMTLPVIIVTAEEALVSVPRSFREGSLALGATKWQTIRRTVLPNAIPGLITGTILGLSRAAGETAPIIFTVAVYFQGTLPTSVREPVMALPYHLYVLSTEASMAPEGIKWGTALTLLAVVLGMNLIAALIRVHYRRKRVW